MNMLNNNKTNTMITVLIGILFTIIFSLVGVIWQLNESTKASHYNMINTKVDKEAFEDFKNTIKMRLDNNEKKLDDIYKLLIEQRCQKLDIYKK